MAAKMASPEGVEEIKSCFYHSMATKFDDFFVGSHPWVFTGTLGIYFRWESSAKMAAKMASPEGVEEIKSCFYHSMATEFYDFFVGSHPWVFTFTLTKKSSNNRHYFSGFSLLKENSGKRTSVYDKGTLHICFQGLFLQKWPRI